MFGKQCLNWANWWLPRVLSMCPGHTCTDLPKAAYDLMWSCDKPFDLRISLVKKGWCPRYRMYQTNQNRAAAGFMQWLMQERPRTCHFKTSLVAAELIKICLFFTASVIKQHSYITAQHSGRLLLILVFVFSTHMPCFFDWLHTILNLDEPDYFLYNKGFFSPQFRIQLHPGWKSIFSSSLIKFIKHLSATKPDINISYQTT